MSRLPSKIYPVVDHPRWVERLGGAGARFIQLRLKDLPPEELRAQIETAQELAVRHNVALVLNDYWELAIELGYEWLHLGQEDLDTADLNAIRQTGIRLGISTHSHEELQRALACKPDYVALGPIWETKLKKMAFGPQGVERLTEWRELCGDVPLVAIGGITLERLPSCLKAGADSVAAVSDFIRAEDPESQVKQWLAAADT
ncbi:thiamine phosphate pyrophosphorylase [Gluconobacter thailandicus F149-1 = NBRC 100600]|uniref:Thiamine-phosphate synthase n=2 Tax=Gluconobacter thailandicus TaxID=257438 RepID=A0AAJ0QKG6_GLUTH|nr:thiamine phosphate synthase [Gluconobacter thailandicus]KXV35052.1 thiamine-phosphate pyrophosphorylase [Gluconobacter thailandicus]KXV54256.1 thiamine-phosphate pyrophosphorylase [Gluconobacter thailandicus]QEH97415.1 thiamine phosphate synthase [Gluconobacter thailandicus]GAC86853.1 thiamine phosphate pyrophosphorylase [Gluconobacter thailandicus NBRC 3255]GAD25043.1 thiamine phosphate pyrophosphorylase [Gluconobacter thailandicus NBRC 3257]